MKREIKFRAWDGERMIAWHQVQLFRWIQFAALKNIMQYTGIKDKDAKEIYDGDIIECDRVFDGGTNKYVILCLRPALRLSTCL